ncbi:conserved hypothetical protein [Ricinus communis]|uniref:Uncharacterized protein n=1 Tax=Ricinus communis TaxID=3988 RepID=B9S6J8_RICCO|nr:conserved hypothetical protein [Ricinus communis]
MGHSVSESPKPKIKPTYSNFAMSIKILARRNLPKQGPDFTLSTLCISPISDPNYLAILSFI